MMNRRAFLATLAAAPYAAALAVRSVPAASGFAPVTYKGLPFVYGTVGGIDRATFTFWRNGAPCTAQIVADAWEQAIRRMPPSHAKYWDAMATRRVDA